MKLGLPKFQRTVLLRQPRPLSSQQARSLLVWVERGLLGLHSSGPRRTSSRAKGTISVAKSVGGVWHLGVARHSGATVSESEIGESSHEASSSGEDEIRDEVWAAVLVAAAHTNSANSSPVEGQKNM